MSKAPGLCHTF